MAALVLGATSMAVADQKADKAPARAESARASDADIVRRLLESADEIAVLARVGTAAGRPDDVRELAGRVERRARWVVQRLEAHAAGHGLRVERPAADDQDVGLVALRQAHGRHFASSFAGELAARLGDAASFAEAAMTTAKEPALASLLLPLSNELSSEGELARRLLQMHSRTTPMSAPPAMQLLVPRAAAR